MILATNLYHLRKAHQLTQRELAEELGLPLSVYTSYEKGKTPTEPHLKRIAAYFQRTTEEMNQPITPQLTMKEIVLKAVHAYYGKNECKTPICQ